MNIMIKFFIEYITEISGLDITTMKMMIKHNSPKTKENSRFRVKLEANGVETCF